MRGAPYLVDSNVLLRWVKPDDHDYPLIVSAIDAILRRDAVLCYTSQNVAEFWNTCTRPLDRNGYGLTPAEADRRARLSEDNLRLLPDGLAVHHEWRRLLVAHNVSGAQVHDARLVAVMKVHGVEQILTFNEKDCQSLFGIGGGYSLHLSILDIIDKLSNQSIYPCGSFPRS